MGLGRLFVLIDEAADLSQHNDQLVLIQGAKILLDFVKVLLGHLVALSLAWRAVIVSVQQVKVGR